MHWFARAACVKAPLGGPEWKVPFLKNFGGLVVRCEIVTQNN
jgi:hypothetical protein